MQKIRIAIIGLGIVGTGFLELLDEKKAMLEEKYGFTYDVVAVCDKMRGSIFNPNGLDTKVLLEEGPASEKLEGTRGLSSFEVIELDEVDAIAEATPTNLETGGVGLEHARRSLSAGKHFVSTNKGAPALAYKELIALAEKNNVYYGFEGTVLSGTPALSLAAFGLPGTEFSSIRGILNGTTNFMLERMELDDMSFDDALALAQSKGYAEANPSGDIDGWDACAKVVILANYLLDAKITPKDVDVTGLSTVTLDDVREAKSKGMKYKMISSIFFDNGKLTTKVAPEIIESNDPLFNVHGVTNAIVFETDTTDTVTVMGPGAGGRSAGYAMLYDLIEMHRHREAIF